jgi:hypothetical protein
MYNPLDLSMEHRLRWLEFVEWLEFEKGAFEKGFSYGAHSDEAVRKSQFFLQATANAVRVGEHFYVERSFQDLVTFAERDMPDTVEFDMSWVLAEHGWLELAAPISNGPDDIERHIICWSAATFGKNGDGFIFLLLPLPAVARPRPKHMCMVVDVIQGKPLARCKDPDSQPPYCTRFRFALMHLLSERIAVVAPARHRETVRGQAVARGIAAADRPNVVMLRRAAEEHGHAVHGPTHGFNCQWVVRGHWRQQPYPSVHEVRPIFIEAYIKGPTDKPLKQPAPRVFVGRR